MNYNDAMKFIREIMRFGSKLGLERMRELLRRLGNPQDQMQYIHVAGTNGKGSTVTMLSEILQAAGYRVGKYTSPYVFEFEERITVDGKMIAKKDVARIVSLIAPLCEQMVQDGWDAPTEFEVVTAIGFCYFAEQKCEYVVLEVGLGGRYDATNVIAPPLVSAITALSMDHTAILGDTVLKIAKEKCGIIKKGSRVVLYPLQPEGVIEFVRKYCEPYECSPVLPDLHALSVQNSDFSGNSFIYCGHQYQQQLVGEYQIYNAITVIETVKQLRTLSVSIPESAIFSGINRCHMLSRFEKVSQQPLVFLDAGHNPQGIDALTALLDRTDRPVRMVFGVMKDKEYSYAISQLSQRATVFYAATPKNHPRALAAEQIVADPCCRCNNALAFPSIADAIHAALQNIGEDMLLICGSFYIMEESRAALKAEGVL